MGCNGAAVAWFLGEVDVNSRRPLIPVVLHGIGVIPMPRAFRLKWLFLIIAFAAVGVSVWQIIAFNSSPAGPYKNEQDGHALMAVLTLELKNGDSYTTVVKKLGEGHEITDDDEITEAHAAVLKNKQENPLYCPDGLEISDRFIRYYFQPGGAMRLQFRDGRLVNHVVSEQTANFFRDQLGK